MLLLSVEATAQFSLQIDLPEDVLPDHPTGLPSNTQLNVGDGGYVPSNFPLSQIGGRGTNVELNVLEGGHVGEGLRAYAGSQINLTGGEIGESLRGAQGTVLNVSSGTLGRRAWVGEGSLYISGGEIDSGLRATLNEEVTISGGQIESPLSIQAEVFSLTGGSVNGYYSTYSTNGRFGLSSPQATISGGSIRYLSFSGSLEISGGEHGWIEANDGSQVLINNGYFTGDLVALPGSSVEIAGGYLGRSVTASAGSEVHFRGGLSS